MLWLGLWGLDRDALYSAECATFWVANLSWPAFHHLIGHVDAVHGFYYALVHVTFFLGHDEVVMRLPSVVGAVGAVLLTYVLASRLGGSRMLAFAAAGLTALAPSMSRYAQSGRSYALVTAVTLLASLALVRAVQRDVRGAPAWPVARAWLVYGVALTVSGYLHELSLVLLAMAHGTTLLWARARARTVRNWVLAAGAAAALLAPLAVLSTREDAAVSWIPRPGVRSAVNLGRFFFGSSWTVVVILAGLAVFGAVAARVPAGPRLTGRFTLTAFAVPLLLLPPMVLLVESRLAKPLYDSRYVLFCLPAGMMLAATGLERLVRLIPGLRATRLIWLPVVVAVAATGVVQWRDQQWLRTPDSRAWNLRQAADILHGHVRPGDGVDFMPRAYNYLEEVYPWAVAGTQDFRTRRGPLASGTLHGLVRTGDALRRAMLAQDRIWLVGDPMRGHHRGRHHLRLLHNHFTKRETYRFHGGLVELYVRKPPGGRHTTAPRQRACEGRSTRPATDSALPSPGPGCPAGIRRRP
jgi:mannosyltransferase